MKRKKKKCQKERKKKNGGHREVPHHLVYGPHLYIYIDLIEYQLEYRLILNPIN